MKTIFMFFLADSILIKASRSIFVKAFGQVFREQYFFDEILQSANNSRAHIQELNELIGPETGSPNATTDLFQKIQDDNNRMFNDLEKPLQVLCDYANGDDADIDTTIIESLDQVHEQLTKLIDTIQKDFLNQMPSGENAMLISKNLEDQIRWYISLVGIILLVFVIIIGLIPIIFFILIIICRSCHCQQSDASSNYRLVHFHFSHMMIKLSFRGSHVLSQCTHMSFEGEFYDGQPKFVITFFGFTLVFFHLWIRVGARSRKAISENDASSAQEARGLGPVSSD